MDTLLSFVADDTRCFTTSDQQLFATLSGDVNPMHMDELAARRTQAGKPVVHGIHAVLWSLEVLAAKALPLGELQHLKVKFNRFIYLDQEVTLRFTSRDGSVRALIFSEGVQMMVVTLRFGPRAKAPPSTCFTIEKSSVPQSLSLDQMEGRTGWLEPPVAPDAFRKSFPAAAAALGVRRLSMLAQLSRLVGMVCPGLYSIFSGFAVDLVEQAQTEPGIGYRVTTVDDRFRLINMAVEGDGISGTVSAFARWAPVEAPTMTALALHVQPGEFAATTALIAGGSRGLGAVTAKLIAAAGGRVIITYARGRDDAARVMQEINAAQNNDVCSILPFDATQPVAPQLGVIKHPVNQLYYFATSQIFVQKPEAFSYSLFADFCRVYIDAFFETCRLFLGNRLSVFYPSSAAVEARPKGMAEYSMAKAAGEMLCQEMMHAMPGLKILINRLPRVLTDQTATVTRVANANPIDVMLPLVRAMHRLA